MMLCSKMWQYIQITFDKKKVNKTKQSKTKQNGRYDISDTGCTARKGMAMTSVRNFGCPFARDNQNLRRTT